MTTPSSPRVSGGLDPLAPQQAGCYRDGFVEVICETRVAGQPNGAEAIVRTAHFTLRRGGKLVRLSHSLRPDQLDNDLAGLLEGELFAPGWLAGHEVFESLVTGVVRSAIGDPLLAWSTFYGNTVSRIRRAWTGREAPGPDSTIRGIAPVYARALRLVPAGSVLDLGSCFGFFPLLLAERQRYSVTASDITPGSVHLLEAIAASWRLPLRTVVCDAALVPLPDHAVDTVTVLHLLEHLEPVHGQAVVAEAVRLAARRVVIAVPFEKSANAAFGHLRCFTGEVLTSLGASTGCRFSVSATAGGWLVLETRAGAR